MEDAFLYTIVETDDAEAPWVVLEGDDVADVGEETLADAIDAVTTLITFMGGQNPLAIDPLHTPLTFNLIMAKTRRLQ